MLRKSVDLEVPSNDKQIDAIPSLNLTRLLDRGVDGMEGAMALHLSQYKSSAYEIDTLTHPSIAMRIPARRLKIQRMFSRYFWP